MPRPVTGTAKTDAERMRDMRARKAKRGDVRRSVELTVENWAKADRRAIACGIDRTAAVNAILAEAPD